MFDWNGNGGPAVTALGDIGDDHGFDLKKKEKQVLRSFHL